MTKWLFPVVHNQSVREAFNFILQSVNTEDDHLYILSVIDKISFHSAHSPRLYHMQADKQKALQQQSKEITLELASIAKQNGVKYSVTTSVSNNIGETICEFAKKHEIDFIVLGRFKTSTWERIFSGSIPEYILKNAPCSILIAHESAPRLPLPNKHLEEKLKMLERKQREIQPKDMPVITKKDTLAPENFTGLAPKQVDNSQVVSSNKDTDEVGEGSDLGDAIYEREDLSMEEIENIMATLSPARAFNSGISEDSCDLAEYDAITVGDY